MNRSIGSAKKVVVLRSDTTSRMVRMYENKTEDQLEATHVVPLERLLSLR